jgi:hypothetical protein
LIAKGTLEVAKVKKAITAQFFKERVGVTFGGATRRRWF